MLWNNEIKKLIILLRQSILCWYFSYVVKYCSNLKTSFLPNHVSEKSTYKDISF